MRTVVKSLRSLKKAQRTRFNKWISSQLPCKAQRTDAQLAAELMISGIEYGLCTPAEVETWTDELSTEWWSIAKFLYETDEAKYGPAAFAGLLQKLLGHGNREVERAAAFRYAQISSTMPPVELDVDAFGILRAADLQRKPSSHSVRVTRLFKYVVAREGLPNPSGSVDWRGLLGVQMEKFVEAALVRLLAFRSPNWNGFAMELDALNQEIVKKIQEKKGYVIPTRVRNIPAHLFRTHAAFAADFPAGVRFLQAANSLRGMCTESHFFHDASGSRIKTSKIYHRHVELAVMDLPGFLTELASHFPA